MASSYTTNKVLEKPANGDYVDTWNVPVNADLDVIDQAFGGTTSLNATGGSATLTSAQYRSLILSVSGAISASVVYTIPSGKGGQWVVHNSTTDASGGPWSITIASGGGGSSVVIARSSATLIYSDGTNIKFVNAVPTADSVGTAQLADQAVTYAKIASAALATASDFRANTSNVVLPVSTVWSAAAYVVLTDAASVSPDFSTGFNFSWTLGGNRTLANPTNIKVGQSGIIAVTQDGTGSRTLAFGNYYKFANGSAPTISSTAGSVSLLSYSVITSTFIAVSALTGVA
jgi:hypothetical protein